MSTLWTNLSRYVLVDSLSLTISALTGLYFGVRFSTKELMWITWIGTQIGVVISYLAVKSDWSESIDSNGNWVGIYFNRNSLGPVALVSLVVGVGIGVPLVLSTKGVYQATTLSTLGVLTSLNLTVLMRTKSSTPIIALGGSAVGVALWAGVLFVLNRRTRLSVQVFRVVNLLYIGGLAFLVWLVFRFQDLIGRAVGSNDIFNGRSAFWSFSWTGFLDRPFVGWGWRAAWFTPEFLNRELLWTTTGSNWSHNAYLEILLGGGIVGLTLFTLFVVSAAHSLTVDRSSSGTSYWLLGIALFVLLASTQEVFVIGNHFLWVLLVASLSAAKLDKHHSSSSRLK